MGYPVKRLIWLLIIVSVGFGTGIAMNFLQIQYAYQMFIRQANISSNDSKPSPCDLVSPYVNFAIAPDVQEKFDWVQSNTARVSMTCSLISGILGFLTIIPLGCLSDRKGRKLVIILTFAGVYLAIFTSSIMIFCEGPIYVLYIACVFAGLAGNGLVALQTQIYTCLSDIVMEQDAEQRSKQAENETALESVGNHRVMDAPKHRLILLGCFDAAVGISYASASAAVGNLISARGFVLPCGLALGFSTIVWIFIFLLPPDKPIRMASNTIGEETPILNAPVPNVEFRGKVKSFCSFLHPVTFLGVSVIFITSYTIYSEGDVAILYLMGKPFCWDAARVGLFMGLRTGTSAIFCCVIFLLMALAFQRTLNFSSSSANKVDELTDYEEIDNEEEEVEIPIPMLSVPMRHRLFLVLGLATAIFLLMFSRIIFGIAFLTEAPNYDNIVWAAMAIGIIAFYNPIMKAILTSMVSSDEQGRVLATNGFCEVVGMLFGTSLQPLFYSATLQAFPGAVFLFNSSLLFLGLVFIGGMGYIILVQTPKAY